MDKLLNLAIGKIGDHVEDALRGALGVEDKDKDKDKDDEKGGIRSFFGGNKDKDDDDDRDKGRPSIFGGGKKRDDDDDDDKGGFFSKMFNKDDDDEKDKKIGFHGLFVEQGGAAGGGGGEQPPTGSDGGNFGGCKRPNAGVSDGDLFNDLMNVAEETSNNK